MSYRVAPDYTADLSVPILDRDQNAIEREIGFSTMHTVQCTMYMCRTNYYINLFALQT